MKLPAIILFLFTSCSKNIEVDSCQRVRCFTDYYNSDTIYLSTDEFFPWLDSLGVNHNLICEPDLSKNKNSDLMGCKPQGYKMIRYKIGNKLSEPKIFK